MNKDDIRAQVRARKAMLDNDERIGAAKRVFDTLCSMAAFTLAEKVLVYHSLPDELSTHEFLGEWEARKQFFLPRVNGLDLEILPYSRTHTHLGAFRIEEPDGDDTTDIANIDLIIVPAVAYDRFGNRVGRGKGYYDRLLPRIPSAFKAGICFPFQLVEEVPAEPYDIRMDIIITNNEDELSHPYHPLPPCDRE